MLSTETIANAGKEGEGLVQLVRTNVTTAQACPENHEKLDQLLAERQAASEIGDDKSVHLIDAEVAVLLARGDEYLNKFHNEIIESYLPLPGVLVAMKSTKSPKSLGEKWVRKGRILVNPNSQETIYNVHDTHRERIITQDEETAYEVFSRIHDNYRLVPGTFDDYIARPKVKPDGSTYEALQGTFIAPRKGLERAAIEVQVRTMCAHLAAENDNYKVDKIDHRTK